VKRLGAAALCTALLLVTTAAGAHGQSTGGRIAFSAFVDGNWDVYSLDATGDGLRRHTFDPADDLAPSWSPDGQCLAFQSHRDGNWEIYRLCSGDREPTRLTHDAAFDGRPAWSPGGALIAFDSFRAGDLDVFLMDADGGKVANLTEDSAEGDLGPAWSPDGRWLAFSSWRYGDPDLFVVAAEGGEARQLTDSLSPEANPVWSSGGALACVAHDADESSEIYTLEVDHPPAEEGHMSQLTWWGGVESPVWSPVGTELAALWYRHDGEMLVVFDASGGLPRQLTAAAMLAGPLSWTGGQSVWGEPADPGRLTDPRWQEPSSEDQELVRLQDVEVGNAKLSSEVVSPFSQLRQAILERSGYDFMASLSDMWRPPEFANDSSDYLSWHKAGRAIDFLWEYRSRGGMPLLEVVPQVSGGEVYWRLYLRCREQDGRQGQPLTVQTWDLSYRARAINAPQTGGHFKDGVPYGYYIDVTTLARQWGWERISSSDQPNFHWHWNFLALEYWHYQQRGGRPWYTAMQDVYDPGVLQDLFGPASTAMRDEEPWRVLLKGIPYPSDGRPWWVFVRP
jgi:TolB protein